MTNNLKEKSMDTDTKRKKEILSSKEKMSELENSTTKKRKKRIEEVSRVTLILSDDCHLSVPVIEGKPIDSQNKYIRESDTFAIKDKCPKCGGELKAKIDYYRCYIWCSNYPKCRYRTSKEGSEIRKIIYEKHGLETTWNTKQGCMVLMNNKMKRR